MAIGAIFDTSGVTEAQYRQVLEQVSPGNQPPPGMLYHVAGQGDTGMWVVEVWESQEALQQFFDDALGQALQAAGINAQPRFFQVVNTMQP